MRLTDVMSSMGLAFYPVVALVLFLAVFVAVVARAYSRSRKDEMDRAGLIPLSDDGAARGPAGEDARG